MLFGYTLNYPIPIESSCGQKLFKLVTLTEISSSLEGLIVREDLCSLPLRDLGAGDGDGERAAAT